MKSTHSKIIFILICALGLFVSTAAADSGFELSEKLPTYTPTELKVDSLSSVGSDSMDGLMGIWVEAYKSSQPDMKVQVMSHGSASAPAALIEGTADLGPMARTMKVPELKHFRSRYGFEPTQVRTAVSGIAVYVSTKNPLNEITFEQLDAIYSAERKRGGVKTLSKWSHLGVSGAIAGKDIMPISRSENSYPHSYFRQKVMLQSDFGKKIMSVTDTASMFEVLAANPNAIAYGEIVALREGVKMLAVSREKGSQAYLPSEKHVYSGNYPLSRFLNVYVVRYPGEAVEPAARDFLKFVLSRQGQQIVEDQGLIPLSTGIVDTELAKLK